MKKKTKKTLLTSVGIIILLSIIGSIFYFGVLQSYLSQSEFKTDDGKGYWLVTMVADSIGEGLDFVTYNPREGTLSDGTRVIPQKNLKVFISKGEKYCEYTAITKQRTVTSFFISRTIKYYELLPPEKVINVEIADDRGNSKVIDGTIRNTISFIDEDNVGEATITTVGSFQGKDDCPSAANLVILYANENTFLETTNSIEYLDKADFITTIEENQKFLNFFSDFQVEGLDTFTRAFADGDLEFDKTKLIGTGRDIGDVVLTISADREYFDSVVIAPASPADPTISDIIILNELGAGSTASLKFTVENENEGSGEVSVKLSSEDISFQPSSFDTNIEGSKSFYSNVKIPNKEGTSQFTIKACGVSQFRNINCDTIIKDIKITSEEKIINYCPDGICQEFESYTICPEDCETPVPIPELTCTWWQQEYTALKKDYGLLGWRHLFNNPEEYTETGCKTAGWVWFMIMFIIITTIVYIMSRKLNYNRNPQVIYQ